MRLVKYKERNWHNEERKKTLLLYVEVPHALLHFAWELINITTIVKTTIKQYHAMQDELVVWERKVGQSWWNRINQMSQALSTPEFSVASTIFRSRSLGVYCCIMISHHFPLGIRFDHVKLEVRTRINKISLYLSPWFFRCHQHV